MARGDKFAKSLPSFLPSSADRWMAPLFLLLATSTPMAQPAHSWRSDPSSDDLSRMYASATPNPTGSLSGPWFDVALSGNVTGVEGRKTRLSCRVKNLGRNQTVSWLRHRDDRLLTVGLYRYTPDRRFAAIHSHSSEDWVLEITETQMGDEGKYVCQVSTTPVRSHVLFLTVADPVITLHGGGPDLHIQHGSQINVSCQIQNYPGPIGFIMWFKGDKQLLPGDRISISLNNQEDDGDVDGGGSRSSSFLVVEDARSSDTGSYRCASDAGESEPTDIHIINGETRAGLQVNGGPERASAASWSGKALLVVAILLAFPQVIFQIFRDGFVVVVVGGGGGGGAAVIGGVRHCSTARPSDRYWHCHPHSQQGEWLIQP